MATKQKTQLATTNGNGNAISLWEEGSAPAGFETISKPTILRLRDVPVGGFIDCTPLEVLPSTNKSIKQPLLLVELTKNKARVALPMQASLKNTLLDEDDDCKFIGKRIMIRKSGIKQSNKWKDDNGDPRQFAIYDVAVAK